ncbi:MAG: phosphopentomutase, partial [Hyphomicrobiales bacterium]|nr:phosphopentomutase [Hyphomicrobiales bacterium]
MARAFILVLDSVGIGGAADAVEYGDKGANTLGHIASTCADGRGDRQGLRSGLLKLPNLCAMGLGASLEQSCGTKAPGLDAPARFPWGVGYETSRGKDTPSGHWEIAGVPVEFEWTVFPETVPA